MKAKINSIFISMKGAIPVLIGGDYLQLPFSEVIDWRLAAIHLPIARITELNFLLRTYSDADIIELRRMGQLFFNRHFISINAIITTTLALIRQSRLQIPSPAARDEQSQSVFNSSFPMKLFDASSGLVLIDTNGENDENLGPIEPPFPSVSYQRNYSLVSLISFASSPYVVIYPFVLLSGYELWQYSLERSSFRSIYDIPFFTI